MFLNADTLKNLYIPRFVPKPLPPAPAAETNGCATDAHMASNDSNSEDSSLSDNDRTLVEDDVVHKQLNGDVSNLHFSNGVSTNGFTSGDEDDEEESYLMECRKNDYYFNVTPLYSQSPNGETGAEDESSSSSSSDSEKVIKVRGDVVCDLHKCVILKGN